ncbi:hypothetical protein NVP2275O_226 [Vibrio phage 2.275.O._10N.286.54.E11]|nr:hypothetical protein NVP2275O_226 [Vibrio phage 2.275.O._10N.286.54.E11]
MNKLDTIRVAPSIFPNHSVVMVPPYKKGEFEEFVEMAGIDATLLSGPKRQGSIYQQHVYCYRVHDVHHVTISLEYGI